MIFGTNKNITGFTLIELMVVISLISVTIFGITRVDFNRISDQQRLDIFSNEVASQLEVVRNNALIGKWVSTSIVTPDEWRIQIDNTAPWSFQTSYFTWWSWVNSDEYSLDIASRYSISNLSCIRLDNTSENIAWTLTVSINKWNLTLTWCSDNTFKILEMTTWYKAYQNVVRINTLSWLIEVD